MEGNGAILFPTNFEFNREEKELRDNFDSMANYHIISKDTKLQKIVGLPNSFTVST